jgi:hypothetical protein
VGTRLARRRPGFFWLCAWSLRYTQPRKDNGVATSGGITSVKRKIMEIGKLVAEEALSNAVISTKVVKKHCFDTKFEIYYDTALTTTPSTH